MPPTRTALPRAAAAAVLAAAAAGLVAAAEVVILKDGTVIQGEVHKEQTTISDPASGRPVTIPKGNGFDVVDEGPKVVVFSTHARQLGEISKDVKIRPEYRAFKNTFSTPKSSHQLPGYGEFRTVTPFDAKWRRTLEVKIGSNFDKIEQQITYIDPYTCYLVSTTHAWRLAFRTNELSPDVVRKLLATHPELSEPDGKADPAKRLAVARFLKDAGWTQLARDELAKLAADHPGPLPGESKDQLEKLTADIDQAEAGVVAKEAEKALAAGRYAAAGRWLDEFQQRQKAAEPREIDRATKLMAQLKASRDRSEAARRLLAGLLDSVSGPAATAPHLSAGGGWLAAVPGPPVPPRTAALADAGRAVLAELHPDSAGRLEFFASLAAQAERERADGRPASKSTDELLATAASGWARGKAGTTPVPDLALRAWEARRTVLAYTRETDLNTRNGILRKYQATGNPLSVDELAQIIALLPPADPEDLAARTGDPVAPGPGVPDGVYRRKAPAPNEGAPHEYFIRLPAEYHHGRAYPVMVALTHPTIPADRLLRNLAYEADRNGYVLVCPVWTDEFNAKPYDWTGSQFPVVADVLRDVVRHFTVDNDRVVLLGFGEGANFAMDAGVSHPDLFAGVVAVGPTPKYSGFFIEYWRNAQKLPMYVVTGQNAGDSVAQLRRVFERWMPNGFPALMTVYKGRGMEWYGAEVPVFFDWCNRQKRVNGTATLKLGTGPQLDWKTARNADNRFYWLGADRIAPAHLMENSRGVINPAGLNGDIEAGNLIRLRGQGVRQISVWLTRDMIDWTRPVRVSLNGTAPPGYKPKLIAPDPEFLLNDYRDRGDRRLLFVARLEVASPY